MRKLLFLLILLIIIVAGGPYVTGIYAKKNIQNTVNHIAGLPQLNLTEDAYQQGWFRSKADYTLSVNVPGQTQPSNDIPSIKISLDINHGPVIFPKIGAKKFLFAMAQANITFDPNVKTPVKIPTSELIVNYNGSSTYVLGNADGNFISYKGPEGSLQWDNLLYTMNISSDYDKITVDGQIGDIVANGPGMKLEIQGGDINSVSNRLDNFNYYIGTANMAINSILANGEKYLDELTVSVDEYLNDANLLGAKMDFAVKNLSVMQQNYGPGQLSLQLNNVDPKALNDLQNLVQQANEQMYESGNSSAMIQHAQQMQQIALQMFSKNFNLVNSFQLSTPNGEVKYDLNVTLPSFEPSKIMQEVPTLMMQSQAAFKAQLPEAYVNILASRYILLKNKDTYSQMMMQSSASANANPAMPIQVDSNGQPVDTQTQPQAQPVSAPQTPEQAIQDFVNKGLLVKGEGFYSFALTYNNGSWTLNGKSIDMQSLNKLMNDLM